MRTASDAFARMAQRNLPIGEETESVEDLPDTSASQNTHRFLDALDRAFSYEAVKEAEKVVIDNPTRDPKIRGPLQDMLDTAHVVWNNFLAGAGDIARELDSNFLHEAISEKLTNLFEPIDKELEPTSQFDSGEESSLIIPAASGEFPEDLMFSNDVDSGGGGVPISSLPEEETVPK